MSLSNVDVAAIYAARSHLTGTQRNTQTARGGLIDADAIYAARRLGLGQSEHVPSNCGWR